MGNKVDDAENRKIPRQLGQSFAKRHSLAYWEVSAQSGQNVAEAFHDVARRVLEQYHSGGEALRGTVDELDMAKRRRDQRIVLSGESDMEERRSVRSSDTAATGDTASAQGDVPPSPSGASKCCAR